MQRPPGMKQMYSKSSLQTLRREAMRKNMIVNASIAPLKEFLPQLDPTRQELATQRKIIIIAN